MLGSPEQGVFLTLGRIVMRGGAARGFLMTADNPKL
jgi:hypothetical protein